MKDGENKLKKVLKKVQNVDFLCNAEQSSACSLRIICMKR
jgi:hypothetical protein